MITFPWVIFNAMLGFFVFWIMRRQLTLHKRIVLACLVLAGLAVASYSGYSEYSSKQAIIKLQQQIGELKEKFQQQISGLTSS